MNSTVLRPDGGDLASRQSASRLRTVILSKLDGKERVEIDLSEVQSISESYADELFGILAATQGIGIFTSSVILRGASPQVLHSLARAIKERLIANDETKLRKTLQSLVASKFATDRKTMCQRG